MQESMERHHAAGRRADYFRVNQRIHNAVIALSRNAVLLETHAALMTKIRRARYQANASQARWNQSVHEHRELLRALEAHDGPRAGVLMRDHVARTGEAVCAVMEEQPVATGAPPAGRSA